MCPTPLGRIHTRVATIVLPALLGLALSIITGRPDWIVLIGLYLLIGVALDAGVYSWLLKYQPPWMTFVLALAELGILYAVATLTELDLSPAEAIAFYWASWALAISTRIAALPIVSLTYLESAGEFRRAAWSLPPAQIPLPVVASVAGSEPAPAGAVSALSGVQATRIERLPAPSGVRRIPEGSRGGAGETRPAELAASEWTFVEQLPESGRRHAVRPEMTLGREDCDIQLRDPQASRRHAAFREVSGGLAVEDLGSANGTFVNERQVSGVTPISVGDTVRFGETTWRLEATAGDRTAISPRAEGGVEVRPAGASPRQAVSAKGARNSQAAPSGLRRAAAVEVMGEALGVGAAHGTSSVHGRSAARMAVATVLCYVVVATTAVAIGVYFVLR